METVKNVVKQATGSDSQFQEGHKVPITHQDPPGKQSDLPIEPMDTQIPTADGGYQTYKAAGKLQGKKAVITGGDSGIGRATAILFAMEGADSTIAYLPQEEQDAQDTRQMVEQYGGKCHLIAADLTQLENCQKVCDFALEKMGRVNILFNNCAYQMVQKDIADITFEQWHKTFNTNIHSFFYMTKLLIGQMQKGDTIINNASINAYIGRPDLLDYTSTKGAIVSFTRGVANQRVDKGIRVNAIAPGPVWTPLIPSTMDKDAQDSFTSPMGRPGQPSEMATCVVFLASADSSMVTGQTIHCNGGGFVTS